MYLTASNASSNWFLRLSRRACSCASTTTSVLCFDEHSDLYIPPRRSNAGQVLSDIFNWCLIIVCCFFGNHLCWSNKRREFEESTSPTTNHHVDKLAHILQTSKCCACVHENSLASFTAHHQIQSTCLCCCHRSIQH